MRIDYRIEKGNVLNSKSSHDKSFWNRDITILQKFSNKKKEAFYREFALLINSGVDFSRALELIANQEKNKYVLAVLNAIGADVVKGKTLFEAFQSHPCFSKYEIFTIKAGEQIRKLPEVLVELQKYYKRKIKMKRQVVSVLAYPLFVLGITFGVLYFMLNYVVPMFSSIFKQFGGELPKITQYVIAVSSKFNSFLLVFIGIIGLIALGNKLYGHFTKWKSFKSKLLLRIPIFGTLAKKIAIAQFSQIMALLLASNVSLHEALKLASEMITLYPLKKNIEKSTSQVVKGIPLSESLETHFFDNKFLTVLVIGEEVNKLDAMLNKLSDQLNEEIDHSTKLIGTILEPLMIVIIAIIVGIILISMYYPMFNLSQVLQN